MHLKMYLFLLLCLSTFALQAQSITPQTLLERSIRYHDPKGQWGKTALNLQLTETRPGGPDRTTDIVINLKKGIFTLDQLRDGNQLFYEVKNDDCTFRLNGSSNISDADKEKFRLNCDRAKSMRNYYTYLWGLPMKLQDEGTQLLEAKMDRFMDKDAYSLKVTYTPEVGADVWYFYFDPTNYALIGYRFYHDESKNDGEYITLAGEETVKGLRLPKERKWYTHQGDKFLGTDILSAK